MQNKSQFKMGAVLSYLSVALNVLSGLLYTPWMITKIGSSQYGLYTLANSLISLFLVDFGLGSATARYLSNYCAEGKQEKVNNFLGVIYKLYLLIDAVILAALIVVYFMIDNIYTSLTPGELEQFKVVYLIAAASGVVSFPFVTLNGILTAYEKFVPLKLADVIYRVLLVGIMVAALLAGCGVYALVAVHAFVGLLVIAYKLVVIGKTIPVKVNFFHSDRLLYRDIFGFSLWATLTALSQRLIFNITPSILGIVSSSAAIAVFGVIVTLESNIYLLTNALKEMFMPSVSRIFADRESEKKIFPLMLSVGKFQYGVTGLVISGFWLLGKEFVMLWMGEDYRDVYLGLLLVLLPGIFHNALQIANVAMEVTKQVKYMAYVNVTTGVLNVVLCILLAPEFGVIGACLSIFIVYILRAVLLILVYHKKLGFDMIRFIKQCYLQMSVPIIASILAFSWIDRYLPTGSWGWLFLKAGMIVLLYCAMVVLVDGGCRNKMMQWLSPRRI